MNKHSLIPYEQHEPFRSDRVELVEEQDARLRGGSPLEQISNLNTIAEDGQ
jgi:hypothetical protein